MGSVVGSVVGSVFTMLTWKKRRRVSAPFYSPWKEKNMTTLLDSSSSFSMFFPLDDEVFEREIERDWNEYKERESVTNEQDVPPGKSASPLFIFDWDDTIFPTSEVLSNMHPQVQVTNDGTIIDVSDSNNASAKRQFDEKMRVLEKTLGALLEHVSKRGVVFIVTNSQTGWVHLSVEKYLPSMLPMIKAIPVISAHDIYAAKSPKPNADLEPEKFNDWLSDAKKWAILTIIEQRRHEIHKVISIGDGLSERSAVLDLSRETGITACSIKMCERPSLDLLIIQQKYLMGVLDDVINRHSTTDLKIKVNVK